MARHVACGLWPVTMVGARAAERCARRSVIVPIQPVSVRQSFRSIPGCRLLGGPVAGIFPASRPSSASTYRVIGIHLLRGRMLPHWPMPLQHECRPSPVGNVVAPVNESSTTRSLAYRHMVGETEKETKAISALEHGTQNLQLIVQGVPQGCYFACNVVGQRLLGQDALPEGKAASKLVSVQRCVHHPRRLLVLI